MALHQRDKYAVQASSPIERSPATDYVRGLQAMHAVWEAKADTLWAELKAKIAKKPYPTMAERYEQAARAIEEMEG